MSDTNHKHRKIEDFKSVHEWMNVLYTKCSWCGHDHHGIVGPRTDNNKLNMPEGGTFSAKVSYELLPKPNCANMALGLWITEDMTWTHQLFECVDELWDKERAVGIYNPYIKKLDRELLEPLQLKVTDGIEDVL